MFFNALPVLLIFLSLGVIVIVLLRRLPEITAINTDTIPEAKVAEVKRQLLIKRLERKLRTGVVAAWQKTATLRLVAKEKSISFYQKLVALEEYYRRSVSTTTKGMSEADNSLPTDQAGLLIKEAVREQQEGRFTGAEHCYLEAIKHDPRRAEAYLGLGLLYRGQKQYKESIEALVFARKLNNDLTTCVTLGETYLESGHPREALLIFKSVLKSDPNNEHYLDRLLEAAILLGKKKLAIDTLADLSGVNPKYHKLVEFKQRINAIPGDGRR